MKIDCIAYNPCLIASEWSHDRFQEGDTERMSFVGKTKTKLVVNFRFFYKHQIKSKKKFTRNGIMEYNENKFSFGIKFDDFPEIVDKSIDEFLNANRSKEGFIPTCLL